MGTVIAGIYEGIQKGVNNVSSDFEKAAGKTAQRAFGNDSGNKNKTHLKEFGLKNKTSKY